jgi:hypothetical protein
MSLCDATDVEILPELLKKTVLLNPASSGKTSMIITNDH